MKTEFYLDYPTVLANRAQPVHFAIRFQVEALAQPRPKPAAFCLVLDRSGSMAGQPLAKAKEAAKVAVRNLRVGDFFALVVFDEDARVVIPLQEARDKPAFLRRIEQITEGGSTNLTGGWMLGRDELRKSPAETTRRLLLLSDGQLNQGIVDPGEVRQVVVAGLEQSAVRTACLGFGQHYNEDLMAALARATNGQFHDADSPEKFPAIFAAELEGLQKLCVQNLRLRLKGLEFCDGYVPLGEYPVVTLPDGRREFAIGDLVSEEERVVCFGVQVLALPCINGKPALSLEGEELLEVHALWDELQAEGIASRTLAQTVRIQATQDPAQVVANGEVVPWVTLQKAGAVMEETTRQLDQGNEAGAAEALNRAINELGRYGERSAEAVQILVEMKRKLEQGEWNLRERKSSHYRSASYRKMSSQQVWSAQESAPSFKKPRPDRDDKTGNQA